MAPQTATRMTYEEFMKLPDDGKRYELIDGELIVNPSPVPRHQMIAGNLYFALRLHLKAEGRGLAFVAPLDVRLGEDVVEPDLIFIREDRLSIVEAKNIVGAPDLLVEVLSDRTRRRDEIEKRKLYERSGVNEYWIIDPELELVKIYRLEGGTYQRVAEVSTETGGAITTPLLPGFAVDVAEIFNLPRES